MVIVIVVSLQLLCVFSIQCDGQDFTARIRELKFHCLLFLNIPKYVSRCSKGMLLLALFVAKFFLNDGERFQLHRH